MNSGLFSLEVCVNGRPVKEYNNSKSGSNKNYNFIEARKGTQYTLKLKNNNWSRVKAVVSVDGLDVIEGKPAEQVETGYLIGGNGSIEIKGYRVSDSDVAAFVFTDGKKSYAAANDKKPNNGVIGVRFYYELIKPLTYINDIYSSHKDIKSWPNNFPYDVTCGVSSANDKVVYNMFHQVQENSCLRKSSGIDGQSARSVESKSATNLDLGTGWGQKVNDKVTQVEFETGNLAQEIELYYGSHSVLESLGVDFNPKKVLTLPKAFNNYCKPPVGWQK